MLSIDFIRNNLNLVKKAAKDKGIDVDLDELLGIDDQRRALIEKVDGLRHKRNEAAKIRDVEGGKKIKGDLDELEKELKDIQEQYNHLMLYVPNIPSDDSPVGLDSSSNRELSRWGEIPKFDFKIRDHVEIGKLLDILDLEQGTKVAGFRGYYLKNEGSILHWAVLNYALEKIRAAGFMQLVPPTLVHEEILIGSGHFPFGKENIYQIANPGKIESGQDVKLPVFLTGTSEPALLAYFLGKTLPKDQLPVKVCAITQCYRSEVGDYGKDTRGIFRVHEFTKVEQVVICENNLEESEKWFAQMQKISEDILRDLNIPYHVIAASTGDMGAGKYKMNDIEAWMPGRGAYAETHSNSNLTDWQARRLNLKFKDNDGKTDYCFTLNNTVVASPRILIAILENFQQEDGSVKIPEALVPYTKFSVIKPE